MAFVERVKVALEAVGTVLVTGIATTVVPVLDQVRRAPKEGAGIGGSIVSAVVPTGLS